MKTILAIFAIACAAAIFALRDELVPEAPADDGIAAVVAGGDITNAQAPKLPFGRRAAGTDLAVGNAGGGTEDLLRLAGERTGRFSSIAISLRYRIRLFDSELIGSGLYQQAGQGSERRLRLELRTQLGEDVASRLQVCDGDALWTYRETQDGAQLERLDLRRVRAAQRQAGQLPPQSPVSELATGGLPKLLEGLQMNFQTRNTEAGFLGEVPMWAVELEWKPSVLAALVPEQQEEIVAGQPCDFAELPQLPQRVMVYLGRDDLFPRRIEYRRRVETDSPESRAGEGNMDEFTPVVTVEFTDVKFDQPIDPRQFEYGAEGAIDVTDAFLQSRGLPAVR